MFPLPSSSQILFNEFIVFNLTIGYILMKGFIHNVCSLPPNSLLLVLTLFFPTHPPTLLSLPTMFS